MTTPSWKAHHKTKNDAFTHILGCLIENPACTDKSGIIKIELFGSSLALRPKKKKKEINIIDE